MKIIVKLKLTVIHLGQDTLAYDKRNEPVQKMWSLKSKTVVNGLIIGFVYVHAIIHSQYHNPHVYKTAIQLSDLWLHVERHSMTI